MSQDKDDKNLLTRKRDNRFANQRQSKYENIDMIDQDMLADRILGRKSNNTRARSHSLD